jgi:Domain of unknown function (DUF4115)
MPESRSERFLFLAGLGAILTLAVALVPAWHSYATSHSIHVPTVHRSQPAPPAQPTSYRATPPSSYTRTPLAAPSLASRQTAAPHKARTAAAPAAKEATVVLAAALGDCWLEVRQGSSTGKVVYLGTLVKGKSVSARGAKLWVRFGAPQNATLKLNGKAAAIPGGTQNVLITPTRVQASA